MSVYDDIREENSQHVVDCHASWEDYMEETERQRVAGEKPLLESFRSRRRAQATQFFSVLQKALLGNAQQL